MTGLEGARGARPPAFFRGANTTGLGCWTGPERQSEPAAYWQKPLVAAHPLQDLVDAPAGVAPVGEAVVASIEGRRPGHYHVEL
jgi:hypothetical protein